MRKLLIAIIIPVLLFSCLTPADYNDNLVREQKKVLDKVQTVNRSLLSDDIKSTQRLLNEAQEQVLSSIEKIKSKDDFRGEPDLRDSMVELLRFYRFVLDEYYPLLLEIKQDTSLSKAEIEDLNKQIFDIIKEQESDYTKAFSQQQQIFAEKYSIAIISYQK